MIDASHSATTAAQCIKIATAEKSALFLVKHVGQADPSFIYSVSTAHGDRSTSYNKKINFALCGLEDKAFAPSFENSEISNQST